MHITLFPDTEMCTCTLFLILLTKNLRLRAVDCCTVYSHHNGFKEVDKEQHTCVDKKKPALSGDQRNTAESLQLE